MLLVFCNGNVDSYTVRFDARLKICCNVCVSGGVVPRGAARHPGGGVERREAPQGLPQHPGPPCARHEWLLPA